MLPNVTPVMTIIVTSGIILSELPVLQRETIKVRSKGIRIISYSFIKIIEGKLELESGNIKMRVSGAGGATGASSACKLPLSRGKCEELANYYLGFNGWSSQVMYHRKEELEDNSSCYVTVVKLSFSQVQ